MSDATQPPADVRGKILRASILPFEDEETLIAGLRAGAEAVERGELDAEDFAGVWSQYLRQLLRASSVPAPDDVRERVAKEVYLWEATRFGAAESWALRSWEQESNTRRELYFNVADRILSLLRTPRGEGEAEPVAWRVEYRLRGVGDTRWYHLSTYTNEMDARERAKNAEVAMRVLECRIIPLYASPAADLRTPCGEGDGDALGMLQASVDEYLWEAQNNPQFDAEAAFAALSREIRAARRSEAQGEGDVGEVCDLCGEEFDPRESGTVIGPLGQDDGVPRWYRCPRCARAYDAGYQQGQRDPRGDEAADPTALRSDAQGEDRWEDLVFGPIAQAYNEAHAARRGEGGGDGD